ncbi:serine hydrolase [Thermomonospora umbrina]|nr:serine hydrolase [Thermomonospora umbrina]
MTSLIRINTPAVERVSALPDPTPSDAVASAPTPSTTDPAPDTPASPQLDRRALAQAIDKAVRGDARLSVAIRDLTTGVSYTYGSQRRFTTASIVKVDILAALLLQAQRQDRRLTSTEESLADRMIVHSDNAAADALWSAIGGAPGLTRANRSLGLRETTATSASWGLTRTSARDQLRLLNALTSDEGPLNERSRRHALDLMRSVDATQAWGVSAGTAPRDDIALKNGWLPRSTDGGRWIINSIGRIDGDHDYLIAVLSDRHSSMASGIDMVEHVTETVMEAMA